MSSSVLKQNKMGTQPIGRLLVSMSVPMMLSMLVQALYNVVDSVFVARISEAQLELTAVSTAFPIQNLMIAFGTGIGVGFTTLISKSLGEGNPKRAARAAAQGIMIEAVNCIIFTLIGFFGVRAFMESQTDNPLIVQYGVEYLSVCCVFCFGLFIQITFEKLLQSTGKTLQSMLAQAIGAIVNIVLDPILIFGLIGNMEPMGIKGAAVATVIGQMCSAVAACAFHFGVNKELRIRFADFKFHSKLFTKILIVGMPSVIMVAIGSVMNYCMNRILFSVSLVATTVFGVYFKLQSFLIMPVLGLNNGMVPIVAFNFGAKNKKRIEKTIRLAVIIAVSIMLCGICVFQFAPELLLSMFGTEPDSEMMEIGVVAFRIISISFAFAGFGIVLSSTFQALGNGIFSMIISLIRQLVVLVPTAFLFSLFGKTWQIWLAFPIAESVAAVLCIVMFIYLYKKLVAPLGDEEVEVTEAQTAQS